MYNYVIGILLDKLKEIKKIIFCLEIPTFIYLVKIILIY